MQSSSVGFEHARPMFPALLIILPLFIETKPTQIGGSVTSGMPSGRRIWDNLRGDMDELKDGMMMACYEDGIRLMVVKDGMMNDDGVTGVEEFATACLFCIFSSFLSS